MRRLNKRAIIFNAEYPLNDKWNLYSFGGASVKRAKVLDSEDCLVETSNVFSSIFPNGFKPVFKFKNLRFFLRSWNEISKQQLDFKTFSNTFGSNVFNYDVSNTNNTSMGAQSPTEFNARVSRFYKIHLM